MVPRKAAKLENPGLNFSEIAAKLENLETKLFYKKFTRNRVDEIGFVKF